MKYPFLALSSLALVSLALTSCHPMCGRRYPCVTDVTPGNCHNIELDWHYGIRDMRIQMRNVTSTLMDRWYSKTGYQMEPGLKPRVVITDIDNRTDEYIALDLMRDVIESVAINDGRFSVVVGDTSDEEDLDNWMTRMRQDQKYSATTRLTAGQVTAPQFLGKVRLNKAVSSDRRTDFEEYRLTITLYDIETQEALDSAWDVLHKRIQY